MLGEGDGRLAGPVRSTTRPGRIGCASMTHANTAAAALAFVLPLLKSNSIDGAYFQSTGHLRSKPRLDSRIDGCISGTRNCNTMIKGGPPLRMSDSIFRVLKYGREF